MRKSCVYTSSPLLYFFLAALVICVDLVYMTLCAFFFFPKLPNRRTSTTGPPPSPLTCFLGADYCTQNLSVTSKKKRRKGRKENIELLLLMPTSVNLCLEVKHFSVSLLYHENPLPHPPCIACVATLHSSLSSLSLLSPSLGLDRKKNSGDV